MSRSLYGLVVLAVGVFACAAEPDRAAFQAQVDSWVRQLAADQPAGRARALQHLRQTMAEPQEEGRLAGIFDEYLRRADLPLETRLQLQTLRAELPPTTQPPRSDVKPAEIAPLLAKLQHDSYAQRIGAAQRLQLALTDPALVGEVWNSLLDHWEQAAGAELLHEQLWQKARQTYAVADPRLVKLPPLTDKQIAGWIDDLTESAQYPFARRHLEDALLRDDEVQRVTQLLQRQVQAGRFDGRAFGTCQELLEAARPAMVAEIWNSGSISTQQYLIIDVPQRPTNAVRATHFDRVNGDTVHCASGNSLAPGDYAFGRALPPTHPQSTAGRDGIMFHLVNLPTPRQRLAYLLESQTPEAERLKEISKRTCATWLHDKHVLSEREIALLTQLDSEQISKFAGSYFQQVEDRPWRDEPPPQVDDFVDRWDRGFPSDANLQAILPTSRHGMVCAILALHGTPDALPGLLKAIRAKRFHLDPTVTRYATPWLAVLTLANKDQSFAGDKFLASLLSETTALQPGSADGSEVGATAAAWLLQRYGRDPGDFGLEGQNNRTLVTPQTTVRGRIIIADDNPFGRPRGPLLTNSLYRFVKPDQRAEIGKWWQGVVQRHALP